MYFVYLIFVCSHCFYASEHTYYAYYISAITYNYNYFNNCVSKYGTAYLNILFENRIKWALVQREMFIAGIDSALVCN